MHASQLPSLLFLLLLSVILTDEVSGRFTVYLDKSSYLGGGVGAGTGPLSAGYAGDHQTASSLYSFLQPHHSSYLQENSYGPGENMALSYSETDNGNTEIGGVGSGGYPGTDYSYKSAAGYQTAAGGYQATSGYQTTGGYQAPGGYQTTGGYQATGGYQTPGGYYQAQPPEEPVAPLTTPYLPPIYPQQVMPVYQLVSVGPEVPVLVRLPNQETAVLPVRTVYSLPSLLERLVERVQNYYSVYTPLDLLKVPEVNANNRPSASPSTSTSPPSSTAAEVSGTSRPPAAGETAQQGDGELLDNRFGLNTTEPSVAVTTTTESPAVETSSTPLDFTVSTTVEAETTTSLPESA